jgi:porin
MWAVSLTTLVLFCILLACTFAVAAEPDPAPRATNGGWEDRLFRDLGGLRSWMARYGAKLDLVGTDEVLGNPTGGVRRGAIYEGLTDLSFGLDFRPYFHWRAEAFARAYQIRGRGLSANNLANLDTASGIEASRTTRLHELWYEQHIGDWLRIRLGQQSAGQEFLLSKAATVFVNGAFGWPTLPGVDLPAGGPGYPLGTPAVRFRVDANEALTFFLGVFNGDPVGPGSGDPQLRDASGTAFRINDGAFVIFETRYNPGNSDANGTYKFGGWINTGRTPDPHFDTTGTTLANPDSDGNPRQRRLNYSLYAIVDEPLTRDANGGLTVFARAMGAPGDRSLVDFYVDGGLAYVGPFGRKDDIAAIGIGYARIGSAARAFDSDMARFTGRPYPMRSGEGLLEITYRMQATPWLQVQPDFQYIFKPGGGLPQPDGSGRRIGDAAVFGLRTVVTF